MNSASPSLSTILCVRCFPNAGPGAELEGDRAGALGLGVRRRPPLAVVGARRVDAFEQDVAQRVGAIAQLGQDPLRRVRRHVLGEDRLHEVERSGPGTIGVVGGHGEATYCGQGDVHHDATLRAP
jgi:hypothetical protein